MLVASFVLWAEAQVVEQGAEDRARKGEISHPLERALPQRYGPGDARVLRQAVLLGIGRVLEHVEHVGPADSLRIVDPGVLEAIFAETRRACVGDLDQVAAGAE